MYPSLTDSLLAVAAAYGRATGLKMTTISTYALGRGATLGQLQEGAGITVRRAETAIGWFSGHWPAGQEALWPADVPRPAPAERAA